MADATDLLTLQEGKRVVHIDAADTSEDLELAVYITAASGLIDMHAGPVVVRSVTDERHIGSGSSVTLAKWPVVSVSAVRQISQTGTTISTFAAADYWLDSPFLKTVNSYWVTPITRWPNLSVDYTAGRVASTTAVDERYKRATGIVLTNLWREREIGVSEFQEFTTPQASFPAFALPNAARQLLAEEMGRDKVWGLA